MRSNKNIVLFFAVAFVLGGATSLAKFQRQIQKGTDGRHEESATVIQEGQLTEKQRQHSKLFKHSGRKLADIAASRSGEVSVEEEVGDAIILPRVARKIPVFQSALCNADAVVIGVINTKSSHLTEEGNFVFTDYEITVDEVVKNNTVSLINPADTITTTRDGGVVELNSRILRATRNDFEPPRVGQRYLLFLRFIPATGSYLMYGNGTFELEAQKVRALGPGSRDVLFESGSKDTDSFLGDIRGHATTKCQTK